MYWELPRNRLVLINYQSTLVKDPLMNYDRSNLGSFILAWIIPKECTLNYCLMNSLPFALQHTQLTFCHM